MPVDSSLRERVVALYLDYAEALDDNAFERWPEFFTEECLYKLQSRENYKLGLPLGVIHCESRGMLLDRVYGIRQTSMYVPRTVRRFVTNIRVKEAGADGIRARANFALHESLDDQPTQLFLSGEFVDHIVEEGGQLKFKTRIAIHDGTVIPLSVVYPV